MGDRAILITTAFLRATATGLVGILFGLYLATLGLSAGEIGAVVAAGLAGATLATLVVTWQGDRMGRRRSLIALALLSALGGGLVAVSAHVLVIGLSAFIGMLNGMGRDRGPLLVLEQAILPTTTSDAERTRAFAWYNVLQDLGHTFGAALAGLPTLLRHLGGTGTLESYRAVIGVYGLLFLATAALYLLLTPHVESVSPALAWHVSPTNRRSLARISGLFAIDSVAGGFISTTLLTYFFFERFGVREGVISLLFVGARLANAASHLAAAWLAQRIGLVNTMVFTHLPSSLLLATVAFAPSFPVAAILFLLREGLVEMDVPTRQSYVMAIVRPEERTVASGVTNLVRLGGWAIAPTFAGYLMQGVSLATPLFIGSGLKVTYDALLYVSFRHLRPPEELPGDEQASE